MFKNYKNIDHIVRLILVYLLILGGFLLIRKLLAPKSFGKYGHYRGDSVIEIANSEVILQGDNTCKKCHREIYEKKINSKHKTVICEDCHYGDLKLHIEKPKEIKPIKPKERIDCGQCHKKDFARQKTFPQIDFETHNPGMWCIMCHDSHKPDVSK